MYLYTVNILSSRCQCCLTHKFKAPEPHWRDQAWWVYFPPHGLVFVYLYDIVKNERMWLYCFGQGHHHTCYDLSLIFVVLFCLFCVFFPFSFFNENNILPLQRHLLVRCCTLWSGIKPHPLKHETFAAAKVPILHK